MRARSLGLATARMCDGVATAPHRFPALSLSPLHDYLSTKFCNLHFVEEAGFDGKLTGFLPYSVISDELAKETHYLLAGRANKSLTWHTDHLITADSDRRERLSKSHHGLYDETMQIEVLRNRVLLALGLPLFGGACATPGTPPPERTTQIQHPPREQSNQAVTVSASPTANSKDADPASVSMTQQRLLLRLLLAERIKSARSSVDKVRIQTPTAVHQRVRT